jgi:hypothetical protein
LLALAILFPVFASAKSGSRRYCLGQVQSLSNAVHLYAADHDSHFPDFQWQDGVAPYLGGAPAVRCRHLSEGVGFAMNAYLCGQSLDLAPDAVLICETPNPFPNALTTRMERLPDRRHGGAASVITTGGALKLVRSPADAAALRFNVSS